MRPSAAQASVAPSDPHRSNHGTAASFQVEVERRRYGGADRQSALDVDEQFPDGGDHLDSGSVVTLGVDCGHTPST